MVQANLQLTSKGVALLDEATESPATSVFKGIGTTMIETYTEESGVWMSKIAGRLVPVPLARSMEKIFKKVNVNKTVKELWTRSGYNGFLAEMGEERLGSLLRAVTGIEDFGANNPDSIVDRMIASIPTGEELLVEAGVLAIPGVAMAGTGKAVDLMRPCL